MYIHTYVHVSKRRQKRRTVSSADPAILHEKAFKSKLSGNGVYYTACSVLVILENLFGKFHCQKVLIENPFHVR